MQLVLDFIVLNTFGESCKWSSSSFCNFLHSAPTLCYTDTFSSASLSPAPLRYVLP